MNSQIITIEKSRSGRQHLADHAAGKRPEFRSAIHPGRSSQHSAGSITDRVLHRSELLPPDITTDLNADQLVGGTLRHPNRSSG